MSTAFTEDPASIATTVAQGSRLRIRPVSVSLRILHVGLSGLCAATWISAAPFVLPRFPHISSEILLTLLLSAATTIATALHCRLVRLGWLDREAGTVRGFAFTFAIGTAISALASAVDARPSEVSMGAVMWALALIAVGQLVVSDASARLAGRRTAARRAVVLGTARDIERCLRDLRFGREPVEIAGAFVDGKPMQDPSLGTPVLGGLDDLVARLRDDPVDEVIVAASPRVSMARLLTLVDAARALPVDVRVATVVDPTDARGAFPAPPPLVLFRRPLSGIGGRLKRVEDVVVAGLALVALSPVLALIALAIKIDSRGPVLFKQPRYGFNNRPINVLKFRTMHVDQGDLSGAQRTVRNDPRVTRIGRHLRRLSIDELPQLINVLRGEMSIVGPRAHAIAMRVEGRLYDQAVAGYFARHRVRPGITGWAQVNGMRGEVDSMEKAERRVAYDLDYIENWSLWLDVKIIFRTVRMLFNDPNAF
ncbi:MAG TPA: exopolysaccharide biosynthesis polyprenyl glycosylphosphotransferase [Azospirillaceae bacterium]|nr:exopolysaccharide biosynthesis polyprenyl glycosylphosphotransferase [Azospirillaceae bacterium]